MARAFRSANKRRPRRRSTLPGTAKRRKSGSDYKPPKEQRQRVRDKAYVEFQGSEPRINKARKELAIQTQCQTTIGGKLVWAAAKGKGGKPIVRDGKVVRYPTIVDGQRCPNEATVSKRRDNATEHKCTAHIGIWYVDVDGHKRNFDNDIVG